VGPFSFPSLFGDANVDALLEGDDQLRYLLEAEPVSASGITGTSATTEAADTPSASGTVTVTGTSDTTESADTSSASGTVSTAGSVTGTIAVTEADDAADILGTVTGGQPPEELPQPGTWSPKRKPVVTGTVATGEADDLAVIFGTVTTAPWGGRNTPDIEQLLVLELV
jgi:hypothetical protein